MKRAAVTLSALLLVLSSCTHQPNKSDKSDKSAQNAPVYPAPALKLAAFDSCEALLSGLRAAAQEAVGPWGLGTNPGDMRNAAGGGELTRGAVPEANAGAAKQQTDTSTQYSGTNTHEAGVDEPDVVKTDGKRIVTLTNRGALKVVDAASRAVTGTLSLSGASEADKYMVMAQQLLLAGDRALVLGYDYSDPQRGGPLLTLVDLAGPPKAVASYHIDGTLVDARQIGSVVRVVSRSVPRVEFPNQANLDSDEARLAANRSAVAAAPISAWLPRWSAVDAAGKRTDGQVDCTAVSRPDVYSGTAMLTVTTFDLAPGATALGSGDPISIVADGDTVYANGPSLYVGNDQRWRTRVPMVKRGVTAGQVAPQRTQLFKFDISGATRPRYVASGEVPGWLLNQYSLSEWDGRLRVATTESDASAVYVLQQSGGALTETGHVGGLGKGERIYSVRFIGTAGYVVTFRQTDPLYTLDLSDPAAPKAVGELKITGYSAYLHPAGDGRLIGIGQEATEKGRPQGLQVSLFDVHDPAKPTRLAQFQVPGASSTAEFDPHAFLFWPPAGLLVVPIYTASQPSALVLSVQDKAVTKSGVVTHPQRYAGMSRSLVIGGTLWTLSDQGLQANDLSTLAQQAWIPFN